VREDYDVPQRQQRQLGMFGLIGCRHGEPYQECLIDVGTIWQNTRPCINIRPFNVGNKSMKKSHTRGYPRVALRWKPERLLFQQIVLLLRKKSLKTVNFQNFYKYCLIMHRTL
jgi:hypothetical protein